MENQASIFLQGLRFEEQLRIGDSTWMKELLRFQTLTASTLSADDVTELRTVSPRKSKRTQQQAIFESALERVKELAKSYQDTEQERYAARVWSTNVDHDLLSICDWRPAESILGEKLRRTMLQPEYMRKSGD